MRAAGNLWGMTCAVGAALCVVLPCAHGAETPGTDDTSEATEGEVIGRWDLLPVPPTTDKTAPWGLTNVRGIGIDDGGIVYLVANGMLYYWDGARFTKALRTPVRMGWYTGFLGGPDRGLYMTLRGEEKFQGKLYRLSDGEAKFVTDFYYETPGSGQVYMSRSGRFICWGNRFVAWYVDGGWRRVETPMLLAMLQIFDTGDAVHVYHNGWMLTIGADDTAEVRELDVPVEMEPGTGQVRGVLWGERTALIVKNGTSAVYAFTLPEGTPVSTRPLAAALQSHRVYDVFRGGDGSVWFYAPGSIGTRYPESFLVLKPNSEILPRDETRELEWVHGRTQKSPRPVLVASDGTVWFAEARGGIAAYRDGTLTRFGWRQGIKRECNWLAEGLRGEIYAGTKYKPTEALHVFHSSKSPDELPKWAELWHEHWLTCSVIVPEDGRGMWMCLADRPRKISCWDGHDWTDMSVPFDTANTVRWLLPDDQGRVVVHTSRSRPDTYLVGTDTSTGYASPQNAIAAAVEKGARRFFSNPRAPSCLVTDEGEIWLAYAEHSSLELFDGRRWGSFGFQSERITRLDPDRKYDVVVCMESGKRFGYDRGQFVQLPDGTPSPRPRGDEPILFPSAAGGQWIKPPRLEPVMRSFGGMEFACDFTETPFPRDFKPSLVLEDAAGNLWIAMWRSGNEPRLFMKGMSRFRLRADDLPKRASQSVSLDVNVLLDGEPQNGWRLFYRLNGGDWQGGELGPALKIEFPEDGTYEVEVIGLGPLGGTTPESLTFTVESSSE